MAKETETNLMATIDDLTLDIEDMIYGQTPTERPDEDQLATAVDDDADTSWRFNLAGTQFWSRGDYAEYAPADGSVGEVVRFMADHDTAGADVEVVRGQRQTTATVAGFSIGDLFRKNSTFTRAHIQRAIQEVILSDLQNGIWYRNERTITFDTDRNRYPVNAMDYAVEKMYQIDTEAEAVGDFGFDETGGTADDLWTISSGVHGLSVGDMVRFSAAGDSNAVGYAAGVLYYVATVESTTEVTLAATDGGSAIAGTGDTGVDWTMEKLTSLNYREFDVHDFEWLAEVNTAHESTGRAVILKRVQSTDSGDTIYYVAKTRPHPDDIASFPTEILNLIPWGVVARLVGGTTVRRRLDPTAQQGTIEYADAQFFKDRFNEMVDQVRKRLRKEVMPQKKFVAPGPIRYG